jgi:hypothetical protein
MGHAAGSWSPRGSSARLKGTIRAAREYAGAAHSDAIPKAYDSDINYVSTNWKVGLGGVRSLPVVSSIQPIWPGKNPNAAVSPPPLREGNVDAAH